MFTYSILAYAAPCRSNNHIVEWSGSYNIPAGQMLWANLKDVTFVPKGYAYCPAMDQDLEPSAQ